jgi:hypothetical protein
MDDGWMDKMLGGSMIDPINYGADGRWWRQDMGITNWNHKTVRTEILWFCDSVILWFQVTYFEIAESQNHTESQPVSTQPESIGTGSVELDNLSIIRYTTK